MIYSSSDSLIILALLYGLLWVISGLVGVYGEGVRARSASTTSLGLREGVVGMGVSETVLGVAGEFMGTVGEFMETVGVGGGLFVAGVMGTERLGGSSVSAIGKDVAWGGPSG